jgi:hypothetical protein
MMMDIWLNHAELRRAEEVDDVLYGTWKVG